MYTFPLLEATCKISFLLPGTEEGLLVYGYTGYVVVSAVRFGNHSEQQTGTKFFWGLFIFEDNTLLVLPRKTIFAYFFCSTHPVVAKILHRFLHCIFPWNY
jgi:hypothetical protein